MDYLFKNININYFTTKIFSNFKIKILFKGDILFRQDKNLDHFILVKEGLIELSLQNLSFLELNKLIKNTKDILVAGAKKYRMEIDEILNFNMEIDSKTTIKYSIIKEVINQKQNFIFSLNKKGFFGEYELFFGIPSLLTGTVASDSCKVYYYNFENYKNLNEETYILNEGLKQNSFFKLKTILKRMVNIYNSYWKLCHGMLNKKEKEKEELINIKNNEEMELIKKKAIKVFEANATAKVNPNLKDIYISHTSLNNSEYKVDDLENFIKLYLNKNNSGTNNKFFRTSLDTIKNRNKSQKYNKKNDNNMKLKKNPKYIKLVDKSNNKDEKKENI
jgi:CRP-like cAMP-binding protein